jgi:UDP-N-acetylmuramoylalanine--D-glutamate ligase
VTGTNGKTTTVRMLTAILTAAGHRAVAAGNVGLPLLEAVMDPEPYDVIAVELSSYQLHFTRSLVRPLRRGAEPRRGPRRLARLRGRLRGRQGRIYENCRIACVYNVADPATERLVQDADVVDGCRAIGFTLGTPEISMVGLVDDLLVDRAFVEQRATSALEVATLADITPAAPHNVANALAATAWPAPSAYRRRRSGTGCAVSGWTRTGSRTSRTSAGSAMWTTRSDPTRTPPQASWSATSTSSGSPVARPRALRSTSWCWR